MGQMQIIRELTPLSAQDSLYIIERIKENFDFPLHSHGEFELNFIENARGAQRIIGDSVDEIEEYELILITGPDLVHTWQTYHCKSKKIREITIQFAKNLLPPELLDKNQFQPIREMFVRAQKGLSFSLHTILKVRPLLNSLPHETEGFFSVISFFTLLYELSKDKSARELASSSFARRTDNSRCRRIQQVEAFVESNYSKDISLKDVAAIANMSEYSFGRFFKAQTGRTFTDYLIGIRIGHAVRAMVSTSDTILEISYKCGFNNVSNFNRLFRKIKGYSPREFREFYKKRKLIL